MSAVVPELIEVEVSVTPDSAKSPTPPTMVTNAPNTSSSGDPSAASTATGTAERARSPPPSCPICLCNYKNKCFTDSCLHQFCFNCLLEWSKIKAECPLCKQGFKSIIHNVKSEREFEEYLVQQPLHYNLMLSEPFRFSYSTTLQVRPSQNEALQRLFLHHPSLTDRYVYPRSTETPNVRRRIYERGLYALPLFDITGRARECSAEFYRANQAQVHRLIPFLNREAIHIIQDPRRVSSLLARATEILTTHDINSLAFRRVMEPYFRENTIHFVHEFYNFARSPYDLYGYDNNVQYSHDYNLAMQTVESGNRGGGEETSSGNAPGGGGESSSRNNSTTNGMATRSSNRLAGHGPSTSATASAASSSVLWSGPGSASMSSVINVISSSSSGSSSEDEGKSGRPKASTSAAYTAAPPAAARRENVSVIQTAPGASNGSAPPVAVAGTSQSAAAAAVKAEQRVESVIRTTGQEPIKIELSDTDSDECQFVLERKAPHLRTPEYVSLNSDEDSDVVFVDQGERNKAAGGGGGGIDNAQNHQLENAANPMQSMRSSNMNIAGDTSNFPLFMPYMLGMDDEQAGPSSAPVGLGVAEKEMKRGHSGELKFKREDPMLAAASSSSAARLFDGTRGRRRSHRRKPNAGPALLYDSSSDDDDEEALEAAVAAVTVDEPQLPSSSHHLRGSRNVQQTATIRQGISSTSSSSSSTTSGEDDSESESSHDEYAVSPRKMSTRKREAIKMALTRTMRTPQRRRNKRKRTSQKVVQNMSAMAAVAAMTTISSSGSSSSRKRHKGNDSPKQGSPTLQMEQERKKSEDSGSSSTEGEEDEEEINVRDEETVPRPEAPPPPPLISSLDVLANNAQSEEEEEDDDENASIMGSAASTSVPETTTTHEDSASEGSSEEIDVQNDDEMED